MKTIYSNCDHVLDQTVLDEIIAQGYGEAEHFAWEFYGVLTYDGKEWTEEIFRYHVSRAIIKHPSAMACIHEANNRFGYR